MIAKYGFYAIWVVSCLAALGSFYAHEMMQSPATLFDWVERICLLPLVIIAGMAAWNTFLPLALYLLPQVLIGLGVAIYQTTQGASMIPIGVFSIVAILLLLILKQHKKGLL